MQAWTFRRTSAKLKRLCRYLSAHRVDVFCSLAFATVYTAEMRINAADLL
jgi:hypothetical protein